MANTPSAKKRVRQLARRSAVNKARLSRIRTFVKRVESAVVAGDAAGAKAALGLAGPELARGVTKGVLHKNTVSRKISRLTKQVNKLNANV